MTGAATQLVRLAPGLGRAAQLRDHALVLCNSHLPPDAHDSLAQVLGELITAAWSDGYHSAVEESRL